MSTRRCPICKQRFAEDASTALPFCSDRCRQIDLGRWLDEGYAVPHESTEETDDAERPEEEP